MRPSWQRRRTLPAGLRALAVWWCLAGVARAQPLPPIPRVQVIPLPYAQLSFQRDEQELARFHFGAQLRRPYVYPVIGPSGRPLTRMGHPGDPDTHSHHNSVWFSFSDLDGVDFWSDRGGGRIRHRRLVHLDDGDEGALAIAEALWLAPDEAPLLRERTHLAVRLLPRNEWLLIADLRLEAARRPVRIGRGSFGPVGVRMAKWIGVHHGGGRVRNSEGAEGEAAIFRKPARWVDYAGQVSPGIVEGIALLDHPDNPRHPTPFHVREDGWMGVMPAADAPLVIEPETPLRLRYGLYVHSGIPEAGAVSAVWTRFAREPLRPPLGPPRQERDCRHGGHRRFTVPREFSSQQDCEAFLRAGK